MDVYSQIFCMFRLLWELIKIETIDIVKENANN